MIIQGSATPDQVMTEVYVNTGTVYSYRHVAYGIVSPVAIPIGLYLPLNANDYVHLSCFTTGTAGPITMKAGSTMNLYRMTNGPTGAQGSVGPQGFQGTQGFQGVPGPTGTLSGSVTFTQGSTIPVNADVDNYSLTEGTLFNMTGSGGINFNGIANGSIGRYIVLINNSAGNVIFKQEAVSSTATNRFS